MSYKRLFIWVEGDDDIRLFDRVIKPRLQNQYNSVEIVRYASMQKKKFKKFMDSIRAMQADYYYVSDINGLPCVTMKINKIKEHIIDIDENRIIIVIKEIECWYLSGLSDFDIRKLRVRRIKNTDNMTKEQFNDFIPKKFNSRLDFMLEILKCFSVDIAKIKNRSFKYFFEKYNL